MHTHQCIPDVRRYPALPQQKHIFHKKLQMFSGKTKSMACMYTIDACIPSCHSSASGICRICHQQVTSPRCRLEGRRACREPWVLQRQTHPRSWKLLHDTNEHAQKVTLGKYGAIGSCSWCKIIVDNSCDIFVLKRTPQLWSTRRILVALICVD